MRQNIQTNAIIVLLSKDVRDDLLTTFVSEAGVVVAYGS